MEYVNETGETQAQEGGDVAIQEIKIESETTPIEPIEAPTEEAKEGEIKEEEVKGEEEKKTEPPKTGLKIRISVPKKESQCKEGSNIHFGNDGSKLCSFSGKLCYQKRLHNYGFCMRHILEDTSAPFQQCQFISKQKNRQCLNTVPINKDEEFAYCVTHKQALGLLPRKGQVSKKIKKPKDTASLEMKAAVSKKLQEILNTEGILHSQYILQMKAQEKAKNGEITSTNPEQFEWNSSSSGSEESSGGESSESSDDGDDFLSTYFLEEVQRQEEDEPDYLRDVSVLTEEEIIMRRKQKIKKLLRLYKLQFHRLKDTLRAKHRKFFKKKQMVEKRVRESKRLLKDAETRKQQKLLHQYHPLKHAETQAKFVSKEKKRRKPNDEKKGQKTCAFERCKGKSIPLSDYCYAHILKDPDQKLFTNCNYTNPSGVVCNYPIIAGQSPPYCNGHIDLMSSKESKPSARKRKTGEENEKGPIESKPKKVKDETSKPPPKEKVPKESNPKKPSSTKKQTSTQKKTSEKISSSSSTSEKLTPTGGMGPTPPFYPPMNSPVFLPHLLGRGGVPPGGAVPIPQYIAQTMYRNGKDSLPLGPETFMHPTAFFYHPHGILFNQPMKMPPQSMEVPVQPPVTPAPPPLTEEKKS